MKNFRMPRIGLMGVSVLLTLALFACQTAPRTFRIGVLNPDLAIEGVFDGFKTGMADLQYVEGETVEYLYAGAVGRDNLPAEAARLIESKVDLILAVTSNSATTLLETGTTIPVVFWVINDPVEAGYVASMDKPGGNMTGVTIGVEGTASEGRRLELLKQLAPDVQRVFVPYNPDDPIVQRQGLGTVQAAAESLGIELLLQEVRTEDEAAASAQSVPEDADAIFLVFADRAVMSAQGAFIETALQRRIPMTVLTSGSVRSGALMSFGTEFTRIGAQAARLADKILKGAKVSEMPVEIPEFFFSINVATAEAIGLEIPESILRQADLVVR